MKKLFFIFMILIFASSASATVYRWVDEGGVVNFADDYSKVPPRFQNKVDEVSMQKIRPSSSSTASGKTTATQPPPISQNLVREGDFAVKLVETLRIGQAKNEAEAESMLASAGIAPKNGWIADYPVTPDIIGELENAVGEAANAKRLSMAKNEALKTLRTTALEFELPIIAEIPEGYAESPPPTTPEYAEPSVIDNYYDAEGPPVITYYPPPWDYYYMYAWVPTPFWCSGFYFPGFFILHDFHRVSYRHGHPWIITNHFRDLRTGRFYAIDPVRRQAGMISGGAATPSVRGFNSSAARNGAQSIFERSRERAGSNIASAPMTDRGRDSRNPADQRFRTGQSNPPGVNNRNGNYSSPSVNDPRMSRTPGETRFHAPTGRTFGRSESMNRQNGFNVQRPSTGQTPSFHPPSQGSGRLFSMAPQGGSQQRGSSSAGSRGFFGFHQGGGSGSGFGRGGAHF